MRTPTLLILACGLALACDDPADEVASANVVDEAETPTEAPPPSNATREHLRIKNDISTVAFTGSKVTGSHEGGFRDFAGTIEFDPATPTNSEVDVTIQTASVFTDTDDLTEHLKTDEFFNVAEIPTARFETTSIRAGGEGAATHTLTGRLTLHGQTQTIEVPATVTVTANEVRAASEFSIDRTDFGMVYPGRADDLIRDRVVIKFDLRAPRQG